LQVYGNTRDGELYGLRNTEKALRADLTNARSEIDHLRRQVSTLQLDLMMLDMISSAGV
jgi:hypothetical protein